MDFVGQCDDISIFKFFTESQSSYKRYRGGCLKLKAEYKEIGHYNKQNLRQFRSPIHLMKTKIRYSQIKLDYICYSIHEY
jgi:hypothetical protein